MIYPFVFAQAKVFFRLVRGHFRDALQFIDLFVYSLDRLVVGVQF